MKTFSSMTSLLLPIDSLQEFGEVNVPVPSPVLLDASVPPPSSVMFDFPRCCDIRDLVLPPRLECDITLVLTGPPPVYSLLPSSRQ